MGERFFGNYQKLFDCIAVHNFKRTSEPVILKTPQNFRLTQ